MVRKMKKEHKIALGVGIAGITGLAIWALTKKAPPEVPPTVYPCPYCGAEFSSQEELTEHIALEHPTEPVVYVCPYCGASFSTETELNTHIASAHPIVYTCPYCGAIFATEEELAAHISFYHPSEPISYKCYHCGASFLTEQELLAHIKSTHFEDYIYRFPIFIKEARLVSMTDITGPVDGAFVCFMSDFEYFRQIALSITTPKGTTGAMRTYNAGLQEIWERAEVFRPHAELPLVMTVQLTNLLGTTLDKKTFTLTKYSAMPKVGSTYL